jgi:hypothetical protein
MKLNPRESAFIRVALKFCRALLGLTGEGTRPQVDIAGNKHD